MVVDRRAIFFGSSNRLGMLRSWFHAWLMVIPSVFTEVVNGWNDKCAIKIIGGSAALLCAIHIDIGLKTIDDIDIAKEVIGDRILLMNRQLTRFFIGKGKDIFCFGVIISVDR